MNHLESNIKILEYMGYDIHKVPDMSLEMFGYRDVNLNYNVSWDWLMTVVDKIEGELPYDSVITIEYHDCIIPCIKDVFDIVVTAANSKLEAVYRAVVMYVEWRKEEEIKKQKKEKGKKKKFKFEVIVKDQYSKEIEVEAFTEEEGEELVKKDIEACPIETRSNTLEFSINTILLIN
jgi:hypothetical protein